MKKLEFMFGVDDLETLDGATLLACQLARLDGGEPNLEEIREFQEEKFPDVSEEEREAALEQALIRVGLK